MEELLKLWPVLVAMVVLIVWIVRLEAKVKYLDRDNEDRKVKDATVRSKIDSLSECITEILESVGRIEGRLMKNGGK